MGKLDSGWIPKALCAGWQRLCPALYLYSPDARRGCESTLCLSFPHSRANQKASVGTIGDASLLACSIGNE